MSDLSFYVWLAAAFLFALVIFSWVETGTRMWRQRERNAFAEKLARDNAPPKGPFAVYLRAFRHPAFVGIDLNLRDQLRTLILNKHTGTDGCNGMRSLESVLAEMLDKDMPLIGLGRRNDGLKASGVGHVQATDAEWKQVVTSLLDRCDLIIMTPSGRAGTAWEIGQLGERRDWAQKTVYCTPNYQVELIRALQPYVSGYEFWFGTSRFNEKKKKDRPNGSIILYGVGIILFAPLDLLRGIIRCIVDMAYGAIILFTRFYKSFALRSRWGKARKAGRKHGLAFPSYSSKGRLFVIDDAGKPRKLADLSALASKDLKEVKIALLKAAQGARDRRARTEQEALLRAAAAQPPEALTPPPISETPAPTGIAPAPEPEAPPIVEAAAPSADDEHPASDRPAA